MAKLKNVFVKSEICLLSVASGEVNAFKIAEETTYSLRPFVELLSPKNVLKNDLHFTCPGTFTPLTSFNCAKSKS